MYLSSCDRQLWLKTLRVDVDSLGRGGRGCRETVRAFVSPFPSLPSAEVLIPSGGSIGNIANNSLVWLCLLVHKHGFKSLPCGEVHL